MEYRQDNDAVTLCAELNAVRKTSGDDTPNVLADNGKLERVFSRALTDKQLILDVDFTRPVTETKVNRRLGLTASRRGRANGLRLSGETTFWDGSTLGATYAYSYPVILPVDAIEVRKGDALDVKISYKICGGMRTLKWAVG